MSKPRYNFYATLLDSFVYFKGSDYMDKQDLLNRINREPFEATDAMKKGTAFHEILNLDKSEFDKLPYGIGKKGNAEVILNDYCFDLMLVDEFRLKTRYRSELFEIRLEHVVDFGDYEVMLYGYLDWVWRNSIIDIKTTARYDFPKYAKGYQHQVYLYIANQLGFKLDNFTYMVTNFKDTYVESYHYQEQRFYNNLKAICNELVDFITNHRSLIHDKKIFNLHESEVKV